MQYLNNTAWDCCPKLWFSKDATGWFGGFHKLSLFSDAEDEYRSYGGGPAATLSAFD